ncbi:4'-phosphopantetheinyl transferase family protein [Janthinobacterium sp. RB2R34]|uniref:4'-phosphopantetheinyl transferase family protein n=1 Tax=Janthinobacterium sp. RB2R34 TaxID=3424193 RepID=UPI003F23D165
MSFTQYWLGDGLLAIGIAGDMARTVARQRIRIAICEAVAQWLSIDSEAVSMQSQPGHAPRLLLPGRTAGLAISHDDGISLAAIHLHGAVGIDVMRVVAVTDWFAVATDYLGPQVASELSACAEAQRPLALAQAWTAREAALKHAGRGLNEWDGAAIDCRLQTLAVPPDYVATLAY